MAVSRLTESEQALTSGAPAHAGEAGACLNCDAPLAGPYCANCGQKVPHLALGLHELVHEATHELTHLDGKVPRTLWTLFTQPARLTLDFLAGRRARWLPPLRLYLICSLAFFLSGPLVQTVTHRRASAIHVSFTGGKSLKTLNPDERRQLGQSFLGRIYGVEKLQRAAESEEALNHTLNTAFPKVMFVLLPLFAFFTRLAWRRRMPAYPAHLYAAVHIHAAWFLAGALVALSNLTLSTTIASLALVAGFAYVVWYGLVTVHRLFGESWPRTVAKSFAVSIAYLVCVAIVSLGMVAYAVAVL